jgi:hypothetical protein
MTERQMRWEGEKKRYNDNLRNKVVQYKGHTIRYQNPVGFGFFVVDGFTDNYNSIKAAKDAINKKGGNGDGKEA